MDDRIRETARYLGYQKHVVDGKVLALIEDSFKELEQTAGKRIVYRIFGLSQEGRDRLKIENLYIQSKDLSKNLKGCDQAVMLGATLGIHVDTLIRRYSLTDIARAAVLQAAAAAFLEEYLDEWQTVIAKKFHEKGRYLRPRFSPGYGDFAIEYQGNILAMLDAPKKIGLTMTENRMLVPTKSVTALIGVCSTKEACHVKGCEACGKEDCSYRRD